MIYCSSLSSKEIVLFLLYQFFKTIKTSELIWRKILKLISNESFWECRFRIAILISSQQLLLYFKSGGCRSVRSFDIIKTIFFIAMFFPVYHMLTCNIIQTIKDIFHKLDQKEHKRWSFSWKWGENMLYFNSWSYFS